MTGQPLRWGYSPLGARCHAVDESREPPPGALKAECGHLLALLSGRAVARQVPEQPGGGAQ